MSVLFTFSTFFSSSAIACKVFLKKPPKCRALDKAEDNAEAIARAKDKGNNRALARASAKALALADAIEECKVRALTAFSAYSSSYESCGVKEDGLPYILPANKAAAFSGTIVLVHGLASSPRHLHDVAAEYQKNGYNVVLPLLYGHGGEDEFFEEAKFTKWMDDVSFAAEIGKGLGGPLYIGGHSTGGAIAALEAANNPKDFAGFVGFDPAFELNPKAQKKLLAACAAKHIFDYASEIKCKGPRNEDLIRQVAEMEIEKTVEEVCGGSGAGGPSLKIPAFNAEISLAGACALGAAVRKLDRRNRMGKMPPSFVAVSSDQGEVFEHLSREGIVEAAVEIPNHQVIITDDPSHKLMLARCSPGFKSSVSGSLDFFKNLSE